MFMYMFFRVHTKMNHQKQKFVLYVTEANMRRPVDDNLVWFPRPEIKNKIHTYIRLLKLDPGSRIEIIGDQGGYILYEEGEIVTILYN